MAGEEEVLFPPLSRFKVARVQKKLLPQHLRPNAAAAEPEPVVEPQPQPEPAVDPQTAAVAQFVGVSGCDEAAARRFLARAEWNLQRALDR